MTERAFMTFEQMVERGVIEGERVGRGGRGK